MVQKSRSKEVWLVPKRASLHQTICLINAIAEKNLDGKTWTESRQNTVGNELRKLGAVKKKGTPSNQSVRTLLASLPQYLGFLFIDTSTNPNTIRLTTAGHELFNCYEGNLKNIGTLGDGARNNELILDSPFVLKQFEKLELTNPIILKDCENISVFPFRLVLELLLELEYLDKEELAYFVFKCKSQDEVPLLIEQIKDFRSKDYIKRKTLIDLFKKTHIGNITLVKAPTSNYFISLCLTTGIIRKTKINIPNPDANVKETAISIKEDSIPYVKSILSKTYADVSYYDFKDNLQLWIEYIGNTSNLFPPKDVEIKKIGSGEAIILVEHNGIYLNGDLLNNEDSLYVPMFLDNDYTILAIDPTTGVNLTEYTLQYDYNINCYEVNVDTTVENKYSYNNLISTIYEHSESKTFDSKYSSYLTVLEKIEGKDYLNNKSLRGAYYEYLFFQLLNLLSLENILDDVHWNGSLTKYALPSAAPGGKYGNPDLIFHVDNTIFVLELTTIKSKSGQEKAEASSVPDHIKNIKKENPTKNVVGIYVAPLIHERVTNLMNGAMGDIDIKLNTLTEKEFLEIIKTKDRNRIINALI